MSDLRSPPVSPRRARVPSGPRPLRSSSGSSRVTSTASLPNVSYRGSTERLRGQHSALAGLDALDLDAFLDGHGITESPESSPKLGSSGFGLQSLQERPEASSAVSRDSSGVPSKSRSILDSYASEKRDPSIDRPSTPSSFSVKRPSTPSSQRPKPPRLNTNLLHLPSSPPRLVSPGLKHWQQVRSHVLAPSPVEERSNKKKGLVSKAAGRFGFRHAADNVIGYDDRRRSLMGLNDLGGLSAEQREEIARERRRFAREVKTCLDTCSLEESQRRLARLGGQTPFAADFSAFAPLLTELHRHLPAARAKRLWSRTCPHHTAILAELGVAFLPDGSSTSGERQQALEVFGVIVKHWASDSAEEELNRWLWLCRALLVEDRQLRTRGLTLLASFLHSDPALPRGPDRPHTASAFLRLAEALVKLLHAVDGASYDASTQMNTIRQFLVDLGEGHILDVDNIDILKDAERSGGIEKELIWIAVTRALEDGAEWLIDRLDIFAPPPLLHATPPVVLQLRALATTCLLTSLTTIVRTSRSSSVWDATQDLLIPVIDHLPNEDSISDRLGALLLALDRCTDQVDHRETMIRLLAAPGPWRSGIEKATKSLVKSSELDAVVRLLQSFLETPALAPLARDAIPILLGRLSPSDTARPFLLYLSKTHPQLLYKPLFSLSASTSETSLSGHLALVRTLSALVGPTFWTRADPQMVAIVLMGDVAPPKSKGKGKEGERGIVNVKLGRYAVLTELVTSFGGDVARSFAEVLEARLGSMLEAEEKEASLPEGYRGLLCALFAALRLKTVSLKRSAWQKMVLRWFTEPSSADPQLAALKGAYKDTPSVLNEDYRHTIASLLVIVHACLSTDDWTRLLPHLWNRLDQDAENTKALVFLITKCAEIIPNQLQRLVTSEPRTLKLAILYAWRFQVLSQHVLTDRRGPIFPFHIHTLEFVATEIGSSTWVPPHDIQDAQLQKFGTALPLELRQRLMELGWTEHDTIASKSDLEQLPVSSLPSLHYQLDAGDHKLSPMKSLMRKGSSGSAASYHGRRKAIFAPVVMSLVHEQALIHESRGASESTELVRLIQRDDPVALLRPLLDQFGTSFPEALARLNAITIELTPAFAYEAFNALVGHLKTATRSDAAYPFLAAALTVASRLVPSVSEMSLRDIRKNKAEHILLPASIHEEEGGFKLHSPWQDGQIDVQTAQLLVLGAILKANPRDVYLVKKMLSNLQIQASIASVSFSRAWLLLIVDLFSTVNRNYNDRAELRHFLTNVAAILRLHGADLLVTSHAMRIFILCSARFRRLFASMGFSTIMGAVYQVYATGHSAIRDCIEYCARSFYRIHQDNFVYQVCVVIAEGEYEAGAVYSLLACLDSGNSTASGVPSGIRGLNDREETDTLVQTITGPELRLAEIGTVASERQASKLAKITPEDDRFPRENIVKLFFTVIAANPATPRAANFLRLLAGIVPHVQDQPSRDLLRDGVEALGEVVSRGKTGDEAAMMAFHPGESDSIDWTRAKQEYISLVESFARSGGQLGGPATQRTLQMVLDLLRKQPSKVGPAAASILRELATTHLAGSRPAVFLKDIAPLFRSFIATVDFSGVLDSITSLIQRSHYDIDAKLADLIIEHYIAPSLRLLSTDNLPLRSSAVSLLCAAVYIRGDATAALEHQTPTPILLASVVLPLCLQLQRAPNKEAIYESIWIRLLHFIIRPRKLAVKSADAAASTVLTVQIVKVICLRAHDSISAVKGLWTYLARYLLNIIDDGDGVSDTPRIVDWIMWSLFELLALHRSPLLISFRYRMQATLASVHRATAYPRRTSTSPRARMPSARTPSLAIRSPRLPTPEQSTHTRMPSYGLLTPDIGNQALTPFLPGHARVPEGTRPSFAEISARRASKPVFDAQGMTYRFPSSQPVRQLEKGSGGAIIHLIGAPSQVAAAATGTTLAPTQGQAIRDTRIKSPILIDATRKAVNVCLTVFGYELDSQDDAVRIWTLQDALDVVSEQTRVFVEEEFHNLFSPAHNDWETGLEKDGIPFQ